MISNVLKRSCFSGLSITYSMFGLLGALQAQQAGETLLRVNDVEQITDAVLLSNVAVADKTIECGLFVKPPLVIQPVTPFEAGNDWLRQVTISLVNRTDKSICLWRD